MDALTDSYIHRKLSDRPGFVTNIRERLRTERITAPTHSTDTQFGWALTKVADPKDASHARNVYICVEFWYLIFDQFFVHPPLVFGLEERAKVKEAVQLCSVADLLALCTPGVCSGSQQTLDLLVLGKPATWNSSLDTHVEAYSSTSMYPCLLVLRLLRVSRRSSRVSLWKPHYTYSTSFWISQSLHCERSILDNCWSFGTELPYGPIYPRAGGDDVKSEIAVDEHQSACTSSYTYYTSWTGNRPASYNHYLGIFWWGDIILEGLRLGPVTQTIRHCVIRCEGSINGVPWDDI